MLFRAPPNQTAVNIQQWVESQERVVDLPFVRDKDPLSDVVPVNGVKAKFKANLVQGFPVQSQIQHPPASGLTND